MIPDIRKEYIDTSSLQFALQQHVSFCLQADFDQILQTDKVAVTCCNCSKEIRLPYEQLALQMFCDDCKDTTIELWHLDKLKQRLQTIQQKLLQTK